MKAVILAGGLGTRISEETAVRPKPMIEIGGKPILWHIMKIYSAHGINEFVVCCGYKGYLIKEYFANYFLHMSNVTFDMEHNKMEVHQRYSEPWKVTLVDTGEGTMKLHAECRLRSHPELPIIDIRVFNYFSRAQDISARFLITDILRAIRNNTVLKTSSDYIVRDYLHPSDFYRLVASLLSAPAANAAVDCCSKAPIDKPGLLQAMQNEFGLRYEVTESHATINATGGKPHYYSLNNRAAEFGYQPQLTSTEGVLKEAATMLQAPLSAAGKP